MGTTGMDAWVKRRHKVVRAVVFYPIKLLFFLLYGLRAERFRGAGQGPYFILSNHTTPLDAICVGTSFHFPVYYVASDHVLRQGWVSRLLDYLVAPIPIVKSRLDLKVIKDMMTVVRQGGSVCLFPEGNRCYNGETADFSPAVAKLAKLLGATLLLYRFEGGYFTAPRWADSIRRGRMTGRVVRAIPAEELKKMTADEVFALIRTELYENAYDRQWANPGRYPGKRLAEALERVLYLCPACGQMATLKSCDDTVACACGLKARYTQTGRLKAAGERPLQYKTVLDWDKWQKAALPAWLERRLAARDGEPLAVDRGQALYLCESGGVNRLLGLGSFMLFEEAFRFRADGLELDFPLEGLEKLSIHGKQTLQFTVADGVTYEVRSAHARSALKYLNLFELLRSGDGKVRDGFFSL